MVFAIFALQDELQFWCFIYKVFVNTIKNYLLYKLKQPSVKCVLNFVSLLKIFHRTLTQIYQK